MLGFNGGRIGVANTTSVFSTSGMWSSMEQVVAERNISWPFGYASGGDKIYKISVSGEQYAVHEFTTVGTSSFITMRLLEVEYLIIGGGGGGSISDYATGGGAGGSGGYRCSVPGELSGGGASAESPLILTPDVYTVIVGDGGSNRSNGQDSVFATITSIGGGHGAGYQRGGATTGGSGGGGAYAYPSGASGTANQGFAGGNATIGGGGGGGGAGSIGSNSSANNRGGNGGNGITSEITGVPIVRGGGGGGGTTNAYTPGAIAGTGGTGGGGNGSATGNGSDGTANTGGGGGGPIGNSSSIGGKGGSGIVIVRYKI